jgi:hypothetical protein
MRRWNSWSTSISNPSRDAPTSSAVGDCFGLPTADRLRTAIVWPRLIVGAPMWLALASASAWHRRCGRANLVPRRAEPANLAATSHVFAGRGGRTAPTATGGPPRGDAKPDRVLIVGKCNPESARPALSPVHPWGAPGRSARQLRGMAKRDPDINGNLERNRHRRECNRPAVPGRRCVRRQTDKQTHDGMDGTAWHLVHGHGTTSVARGGRAGYLRPERPRDQQSCFVARLSEARATLAS